MSQPVRLSFSKGSKLVLDDDIELFFVDKTTLMLAPPRRTCWMKFEQQMRIPTTQPGFRQERHVFGENNCLQGRTCWITMEIICNLRFIRFLEHLMIKQYLIGRVS